MDMWYLVSLVTHLNKPRFLEIVLVSSSLKKIQVKSSMNTRELKWLSLWQATVEYLKKVLKLLTKEAVHFDQLKHWQNTDVARRQLLVFF